MLVLVDVQGHVIGLHDGVIVYHTCLVADSRHRANIVGQYACMYVARAQLNLEKKHTTPLVSLPSPLLFLSKSLLTLYATPVCGIKVSGNIGGR